MKKTFVCLLLPNDPAHISVFLFQEKDRQIQLLRKELTESREQNRSYERTIAELRHGKVFSLSHVLKEIIQKIKLSLPVIVLFTS